MTKKINLKALKETQKINENKEKDAAKTSHKFKPAKWTHPNGHPRCIICGQEERIDGMCERLSDLKKGERGDWKKEGYKINHVKHGNSILLVLILLIIKK